MRCRRTEVPPRGEDVRGAEGDVGGTGAAEVERHDGAAGQGAAVREPGSTRSTSPTAPGERAGLPDDLRPHHPAAGRDRADPPLLLPRPEPDRNAVRPSGGYAAKLANFLIITGDPPKLGEYPT